MQGQRESTWDKIVTTGDLCVLGEIHMWAFDTVFDTSNILKSKHLQWNKISQFPSQIQLNLSLTLEASCYFCDITNIQLWPLAKFKGEIIINSTDIKACIFHMHCVESKFWCISIWNLWKESRRKYKWITHQNKPYNTCCVKYIISLVLCKT